eukprot:gnl/TRDRNA2_/TRDRNA2_161002_c6_seq1.p1 gnl/TRDRNA2_/TRDRNA2_161002_c6~~gnl/TRDRNA2_/TRDRNA2_161002_c6_seq1.p1  ORF type:complete len:341 (+),score=42.83 gnl/TRDRNA2_/TRDRNA2_161002_c6_seq1:30-1025(+)
MTSKLNMDGDGTDVLQTDKPEESLEGSEPTSGEEADRGKPAKSLEASEPTSGEEADRGTSTSTASEIRCRICLEGDEPTLGRLFSPCRCAGSIGLVHYQCLQRWRLSSDNFSSEAYHRCGACLYKYRVERHWLAWLLLSPNCLRAITAGAFAAAVCHLGFIFVQVSPATSSAIIRALPSFPTLIEVPVAIVLLFSKFSLNLVSSPFSRVVILVGTLTLWLWPNLSIYILILMNPAVISGFAMLSLGGFLVHILARLSECLEKLWSVQGRRDVVVEMIWTASCVQVLGHEAKVYAVGIVGLVESLLELHGTLACVADEAVRNMGERVLDVAD